MTRPYTDICRLHGQHHCLDCGYLWYQVDDDGTWTPIPGTGDGV